MTIFGELGVGRHFRQKRKVTLLLDAVPHPSLHTDASSVHGTSYRCIKCTRHTREMQTKFHMFKRELRKISTFEFCFEGGDLNFFYLH